MTLVETIDVDRTAFIKQHFGIEWPSPAVLPHDGQLDDGRASPRKPS